MNQPKIRGQTLDFRSSGGRLHTSWYTFSILAIFSFLGFQTNGSNIFAQASYLIYSEIGNYRSLSTNLFVVADDEQQGEWIYYTQSGDTLGVVAARFKVRPQDIQVSLPVKVDQLLDPGQMLIIPRPVEITPIMEQIMPDYEVVYSASVKGFDTQDYVSKADGYLNDHQEYMRSTGLTSGAEIVQRVAVENSINPRLLLALLEFQCGCVLESMADGINPNFLLGIDDPNRKGLYRQLGWVVNQLSLGYYGWRRGILTDLGFPPGPAVHLPPDLNAGSVSIAYLFSRMYDREGWDQAMDPKNGFRQLYKSMFSETWREIGFDESLFPAGLKQPDLRLPFDLDKEWGFTSGPHQAWETEGALAALDFAPASERSGCYRSNAWVVAVADGLVVRSEHGAVVLDLDGDGFESTGWAILYMHLESRGRVAEGTYLQRGDKIGHPSCEGGPADGTHIHIARKFNGEWIAADGPLPFVMSGWIAQGGFRPYVGSLIRGEKVVVANPLTPAESFISLSSEDLLLKAIISHNLWWEE
jgi:murein DD-endopeptidase MepM/ murein hydrolase activator NlpD